MRAKVWGGSGPTMSPHLQAALNVDALTLEWPHTGRPGAMGAPSHARGDGVGRVAGRRVNVAEDLLVLGELTLRVLLVHAADSREA